MALVIVASYPPLGHSQRPATASRSSLNVPCKTRRRAYEPTPDREGIVSDLSYVLEGEATDGARPRVAEEVRLQDLVWFVVSDVLGTGNLPADIVHLDALYKVEPAFQLREVNLSVYLSLRARFTAFRVPRDDPNI